MPQVQSAIGALSSSRARARLRDAGIPLGWAVRRPLRFARGVTRLAAPRLPPGCASLLAQSGLFDAAHYRAVHGWSPLANTVARFLLAGDAAGESPHPLFDPTWYRQQNPIWQTGPAAAALPASGGWELRNAHPLFDARHYLAQWPPGSVSAVTALTPLSHYVRVGAFVGCVAAPVVRWQARAGAAAGYRYSWRRPAAPLSAEWRRRERWIHIRCSRLAPLHGGESRPGRHQSARALRSSRRREGRSPHPLLDIGFYWEQRPDVRAHGETSLLHYLHAGMARGSSTHIRCSTPVSIWSRPPGCAILGINPLVHYLRWGWRDGLWPNPWFNPRLLRGALS